MKTFYYLFIALLLLSCESNPTPQKLTKGNYRGILHIQDEQVIPFTFEVLNEAYVKIFNAEEVIDVHEITYKNDSIKIQLPYFEGYISAKLNPNNELKGYFIKPSLNRTVPFSAVPNQPRFSITTKPTQSVTGNWETVFSPDTKDDRYIAKGIFSQVENKVTGTFRTTTGDYRYLEGVINGNRLELSTFDGAHAFLFTATVSDSIIQGTFYSGSHWKEPFTAKLNNNYKLPDAEKLTHLKEGYKTFEFSFPNETGQLVSLKDTTFQNKVTVVQIMGTWCPNCLDESKFYSQFYKQYKSKDLAFVGLAFEVAKTQKEAFELINRLKKQIGITYPILLAQYGSSDKISAQEKLPMLNHVLSYPTTVFLDKKGNVRKIHTGFNGPATGQQYIDFKNEFEKFINELLAENE